VKHDAAFCPHCGYDLRLDTPILLNDFSMMSSYSHLRWRGEAIPLTSSERLLCYTLMKAYPSPVKLGVILDRIGSEASGNVIDVYVCRIRKKLRKIGAPNPITCPRTRNQERALAWATGEGDRYATSRA
jgi:DNA-binding response OmpR family regulator